MKKINHKLKISLNKKVYLSLAGFVVIGGVGIYFINSAKCKDCVFNQDGIKITNSELNEAVKARETFYKYNKQEISADILETDVLKQLKDEKRIQKYAKENNVKVSQSEVDDLYQERVRQNKSEEELLAKIKQLYGYTKEEYQKVLEYDVLRAKVQTKVNEPLAEWLSKQPDKINILY
jgi:parvulin-like peptidyl-prolyl isomerase